MSDNIYYVNLKQDIMGNLKLLITSSKCGQVLDQHNKPLFDTGNNNTKKRTSTDVLLYTPAPWLPTLLSSLPFRKKRDFGTMCRRKKNDETAEGLKGRGKCIPDYCVVAMNHSALPFNSLSGQNRFSLLFFKSSICSKSSDFIISLPRQANWV